MELSLDKYKSFTFNTALVLVAIALTFNFIYTRQIKEIELLKKKKDIEIKKTGMFNDISQLENRVNAYRDLFVNKDISAASRAISDMAKRCGVKIISIKSIPEEAYSGYIKLPFDMVINVSSYHVLGKFISQIENSRDLYMVDAFSLRPAADAKGMNVDLRLSAVALAPLDKIND